MPGPEYNSSLRRCDLYDNPYNTHMQAHPAIVKQRQDSYATKDSISFSQKKLENELFEAFKQHSMQMFSGKFFIIGQAGKYAFLAVMLPTYLFFYGIPKWLLTEAAPTVYDFTKRIVTHAGSKIGSAVSHAATAAFGIVRTVTDPILNFIQTRIEKGREFYHHVKYRIQQWVRSTAHTLAAPFRAINAKIVQPVIKFYQHLAETAQSIKQKAASLLDRLKEIRSNIRTALIEFPEKVEQVFRSLPEKFKGAMEKLTKPFDPVLNAFKAFDNRMKNWFDKAVELKNRVMNSIIYTPASAVFSALKNARDWTKEAIARTVTEPLAEWAKPKIDKVVDLYSRMSDTVNHVKEAISSKFRQLTDKVNETVKRYSEDTSAFKQDIAQILPQPVIAFFTPLAIGAAWVVKAPVQLFKKRQSSNKRIAKIKEKVKLRLVRLHHQFISFLKKGYKRAKPKFIAVAKKTAKGCLLFFQVISEMLKGALYMIRLIFAWLKVLFRHGMLMVKDACAALLPRI